MSDERNDRDHHGSGWERNTSVSDWEREVKQFMDDQNEQYAAAVAARRDEQRKADEDMYEFIRMN